MHMKKLNQNTLTVLSLIKPEGICFRPENKGRPFKPALLSTNYFFDLAGFFVFLGAHLEGFLVFLGAHVPQPIVHPPFINKGNHSLLPVLG